MEKYIAQEYDNPIVRKAYLSDNADAIESKGYMKPYTPEQLQSHKENLANVSIQIAEIEAEKKQSDEYFKGQLKPLKEQRAQMVSNIKAKAEYVTEDCFKFTDQEARMTGYYNADGELVECRPATADELQPRMFPLKYADLTHSNNEERKVVNS